ncbi:MAG: hypothetical protein AB7O56_12915 [Bauldia sp.]
MSKVITSPSSVTGPLKVGPAGNSAHIVAPGKGLAVSTKKSSLAKGRPGGAPRIIRRPGQ